MLDSLISPLMPHHCISCGEFGDGLCDYCKYDIEFVPVEICVSCGGHLQQNRCRHGCGLTNIMQVVMGSREGVLERLIDDYKFQPARSFGATLAQLLDRNTPLLPQDAVIVPIPTASPHIRERGFDHLQKLTSEFAKRRQLKICRLLTRKHNLRQFGASRTQRQSQAQAAFDCTLELSPTTTYIVFDDVITTGATVVAVCDKLRQCGADQIIVLALARQSDVTKS